MSPKSAIIAILTPKNRRLGLVIVAIVISALMGGTLGWFFPNFAIPKATLNQHLCNTKPLG